MAAPSELHERTRWDPADAEPRLVARWLSSGLFHPEPEGTAEENWSLAIPPPNVTGSLHLGHGLVLSIEDVLVRYHRMLGKRTKWIFGTDHAGIATQRVVERELEAEGTTREAIGRTAFTERVWDWRRRYGSRIVEQSQRMGASCDFEDERFTLDPDYVRAVMKVFVALYEKGLIYRDRYLVNWDPGLRSAISDLEVEEREVTDTLYAIAYPLLGGGEVVVSTVRPETMLADTAVAVHPDDERYRDLVGGAAELPLVGRRLPIIADPYVKPEFGTGALKITPGHDPNDFEIGRAHHLEEITVIGEDGRITDVAPTPYVGLPVLEARERVVADLRELGLLRGEEPYTHAVPFSHRSGARVEPLISLQWFMRMEELAAPAMAAVHDGRLRITPERWSRVYLDWLENIRPWCISRQLWWGHRLPVWYRDDATYVGEEPPDGEGWERDPDVLDTWFSSGLWPLATLGWPQETPALKAFYPTKVLDTARDILFLWVARMVMFGLEFTGEVPFSDVYIHSVIQAPDGRRMSKSLGTGIDPLDEIAEHGADGVRFGLLAMSSSQDVRYSAEKVAQGSQLANKLWNASRLILLGVPEGARAQARPQTIEDRWILSRLQRATQATAERIEAFDFSHAALGLYDFVYGELCDWYLELVKPRLYDDDADAAATLLHVLERTLALAHPVIPFVTEEIWSYLPEDATRPALLAGARFPSAEADLVDAEAEARMVRVIGAVTALRGWREQVGAPAREILRARLEAAGYDATLDHVARLARFAFDGAGDDAIASVSIPEGTVHVLPTDAVDLEAAGRRRAAARAKLESELQRAQSKLANDGFVAKAPPAVVQAERDKAERLQEELEAL
ncbi:MAG TPA: valine--tRNA ligase [Solirubrobacteraceae bacterium]